MQGKKWQKMSLEEQLGNIGSEVARAFFWREKDKNLAEQFAKRALGLFDLTTNDFRWQNKLKEVLKIREVFCDCFFQFRCFTVKPSTLKKYFIPFALLNDKRKNETPGFTK